MKKIFVIATALLMCCMFMGCGVKAQLVGTWKGSNTYGDSEEDSMYTLKIDNTLNINKDGSYSWVTVRTETYTPTVGTPESDVVTYKQSGSWYYHDSDKVILKITKNSYQVNDEEPEEHNEVGYGSAEVVLVDDILFVEYDGEIVEFTKSK